MTSFFSSILLLLTIVAAFAFGVAAGYWVICGLLNWLNRSRTATAPARTPAFASNPSGD
jgi:hypothetical protein